MGEANANAGAGSMHVVMVPWMAFGHIIPFTELAKRIARQGHRVTLFSTPRNTRRLIRIPPELAGRISVVDIALPRVDGRLPEDAEATIDLPSDDLRPYLRVAYDAAFADKLSAILQEPGPAGKPDWVVIDYAAHWAPAAAARHGVPCAFLSLFAAAALSFYGPPEALMGRGKHARTKPEDLTAPPDYVPFPTTVAYRGFEARELFGGLDPDHSGLSEGHRFIVATGECQVVGIRSRTELEPEWLQVLEKLYQKPVIPVGLFPPPPTQDISGHEETLRWLDGQAQGSVVYAAFGSEAKLTSAQLQTIALGLEASGLPFVWAFRPPAAAAAKPAGEGTAGGLPEGFEERVSGRGLVCRGWVPQPRLLAHESVGGFLTHAGWNSIAEGLSRGVRMVLLPLMFDQGLNARLLAEKKIGVEVERDEDDGSFAPKDIADALRTAMVENHGGTKVKELAEVFGNDEANDQCLRDFLRYLSEYSRQHQGWCREKDKLSNTKQ